ncbi:MAG TPA: T9SS type A sorting domain-containing protein [Chitinophagales bacterium]|nr:T9SS type A sorting domain-containing protein [Chitinophagales bacterium]
MIRKKKFCLLFIPVILLPGIKNVLSQSICLGFFNESSISNFSPEHITSADFNNDGNVDLATTNYTSNTVSILLGNGDGTFGLPVNYVSGLNPSNIVTSDFNADGNADLSVSVEGAMLVYLGNGNGTLADSMKYYDGSLNPWPLTVVDFNNDSIPDILSSDYDFYHLWTWLGNGDGSFSQAIGSWTNESPCWLSVADFNNDGFNDVVYTHNLPPWETIHSFSVIFGNGSGTFGNEVKVDSIPWPYYGLGGDVNNDNKMDVIVYSRINNNGYISIYYGNGDGTFNLPSTNYPSQSDVCGIKWVDMNNDSMPDIVVVGTQVSVLPGMSDGTFDSSVFANGIFDTRSFTINDFNNDGFPDMVITNYYNFDSTKLVVLLNCGTTGIESYSDESSVLIYPILLMGNDITVNMNDGQNGSVTYMVADLLGENLITQSTSVANGVMKIDLPDLVKGFYILKVNFCGQLYTSKILKVR